METLIKCEALDSRGGKVGAFPNERIFEMETYPEWSRVKAAIPREQIPQILQIARAWKETSFGILYVLKSPRLDHEPARYQSASPCDFEELRVFLFSFQNYFEQDARHELWVIGISSGKQVVYDEHNLLYIYGMDEECKKLFAREGLAEGAISIPAAHSHNFHSELDSFEDKIFKYWEWVKYPLEPADED